MSILLAIIVGGLFGFALHRAGAGNPQYIIQMLRLRDMHLAKVILFAIGFSSLLLFSLLALGVIEQSHISIKTAYLGVVIGGLIFGAGFAVGGYCPGTCLVGAAGGRIDAVYFVLGGLVGAGIFTIMYGSLTEWFPALFNSVAGGKTTLASTGIDKYPSLFENIPAIVIAGTIAIIFMLGAWKLPKKLLD